MPVFLVIVGAAVVLAGLVARTSFSSTAATNAASFNTTPAQDKAALNTTLAWLAKKNVHPKKHYRIAWVKEDAGSESYTQHETKGGLDAAKKFGGTVKIFDAKFNPNQQFRDLQDAITGYKSGQYDAIMVTPVAGAVVCNEVRSAIKQGIPIEVGNLSVCGDKGYTPGAIGYVGMQQQRAEDQDIKVAFSSCKTPCKALVISGPVGFDLTTRVQNAVKKYSKIYKNVQIVANQNGNFTPTDGFRITQTVLTAHPDITMISTDWDDETVGVVRAVKAAGKVPGKDIKIYSVGGDSTGLNLVKSGQINATDIVTPYHDGLYGMAQVFYYLVNHKKIVGSVWPGEAPFITKTLGTRVITKANVNKWKPEY